MVYQTVDYTFVLSECIDVPTDAETTRVLQYYGHTERLRRLFLIPSDMPLYHLHGTLKKLYGFDDDQNHSFSLDTSIFLNEELSGYLFQESFFLEDQSYLGPYRTGNCKPGLYSLNENLLLEDLLTTNPHRIPSCYEDLVSLSKKAEIIRSKEDPSYSVVFKNVASSILYHYGNWQFQIVKLNAIDNWLLEKKVKQTDLDKAIELLRKEYKPVCLYYEGYPIPGGLDGLEDYVSFLRAINTATERLYWNSPEKKATYKTIDKGRFKRYDKALRFAKQHGWTMKTIRPLSLL